MTNISAVLTVSAQVAGAAGLVTVSSKAATWMRDKARFHQDAEFARQILGLHQHGEIAYRHDSRHVLYTGTEQLHPDNLYGLSAASGNDYKKAEVARCLEIADSVPAQVTNDLVLIGSPTAEGLSRILFGYRQDAEDKDSLTLDDVPLDLPFRWEISKAQVDERAVARRFVAGLGLVERPNWRIVGPDRMYVPRVDEDGMLQEDYLLVTKVRNYLSPSAMETDHYIVSFGGTHGTGTRALSLLYRDRGILRKVAEALRTGPAAFQLLLRVGNIDHDPVRGSHARDIQLVRDAVILPDNDAVWRTAAQCVRKELS